MAIVVSIQLTDEQFLACFRGNSEVVDYFTDEAITCALSHAQALQEQTDEPLSINVINLLSNALELTCSDIMINYNRNLQGCIHEIMTMTRDLVLSDEVEAKIYVDGVNEYDILDSVYNQLIVVPEWEVGASTIIAKHKGMQALDNGNWLHFDYYEKDKDKN